MKKKIYNNEDLIDDFKKGDLVDIITPNGQKIGIGIAKYGKDDLINRMGQKDQPEFIHYDKLHIY